MGHNLIGDSSRIASNSCRIQRDAPVEPRWKTLLWRKTNRLILSPCRWQWVLRRRLVRIWNRLCCSFHAPLVPLPEQPLKLLVNEIERQLAERDDCTGLDDLYDLHMTDQQSCNCSGLVPFTWHLSRHFGTQEMNFVSHQIDRNELKPGDAPGCVHRHIIQDIENGLYVVEQRLIPKGSTAFYPLEKRA